MSMFGEETLASRESPRLSASLSVDRRRSIFLLLNERRMVELDRRLIAGCALTWGEERLIDIRSFLDLPLAPLAGVRRPGMGSVRSVTSRSGSVDFFQEGVCTEAFLLFLLGAVSW